MPAFFGAADALIVHLRPSEIAEHAIPAKILAYLAAGKPIVCAVPGAAADLVRDAGAGSVVAPGDARALAAAMLDLAARHPSELQVLGGNGRRYFAEHFSRAHVMRVYEDILHEAAGMPRPRDPAQD
jgi:colanic acid biosynthesis glycosyl transferase WcaI